jgi:2-haloacid dehalogenase
MRKPRVILFDLVETLLDVSSLDRVFRAQFGSARVRREWFEQALRIAFSATAANEYAPFSEMLKASLTVMEERHDTKLSWFGRRTIFSAVRAMPIYPDVEPGLRRLSDAGFRLAVLTNSAKSFGVNSLKQAGVLQYFDEVLSSESVKRLKPAHQPYRYAAKKLRTNPKEILMVAAHDWDVTGAHAAEMQTCFLRRSGQFLNELAPEPEMNVAGVEEMARQLTNECH